MTGSRVVPGRLSVTEDVSTETKVRPLVSADEAVLVALIMVTIVTTDCPSATDSVIIDGFGIGVVSSAVVPETERTAVTFWDSPES